MATAIAPRTTNAPASTSAPASLATNAPATIRPTRIQVHTFIQPVRNVLVRILRRIAERGPISGCSAAGHREPLKSGLGVTRLMLGRFRLQTKLSCRVSLRAEKRADPD